MILVAGEGGKLETGVRLDHELPNRPPAAKTSAAVQQAEARMLDAVRSRERVAKDLQPGADGEYGRAPVDRSVQRATGAELAGRQHLRQVFATPEDIEVT
jgi:hypothetical protein